MDSISTVSRSLPLYASGPVIALYLLMLVVLITRSRSRAASFVLFAIGMRLSLSAMHQFTYSSSPLGLSYNALGSILIFFIGLFVVRWRKLSDPALIPFYPLLAVMIASGLINGQAAPLAETLTKYGYLIVLIMAVADAIEDLRPAAFFKKVLPLFLLPLVLQAASLALNVPKPGEVDGATSWIGGFHHEAGFSMTLAAGVLVVSLAHTLALRYRLALILVGLVAIVLANYRTTILGIAPLLLVALLGVPRKFVAEQRGLVLGLMCLLGAAGVGGAVLAGQDRFADLEVAAESDGFLIQEPGYFSPEQRRTLSGRPYIWSMYIYGWREGSDVAQVIGAGPETWEQNFRVYAHNTLVSALYETGVVGVLATLFMWGGMLVLVLLARGGPKLELLAGHLSFFILNMATMPMWMIEGMIFYGLVCGYTVYSYKHRERSPAFRNSAQSALPAAG